MPPLYQHSTTPPPHHISWPTATHPTVETVDDDNGSKLPWQSIAAIAIIVAAAEGVAIVNMQIPPTRQATSSLSAAASGRVYYSMHSRYSPFFFTYSQ